MKVTSPIIRYIVEFSTKVKMNVYSNGKTVLQVCGLVILIETMDGCELKSMKDLPKEVLENSKIKESSDDVIQHRMDIVWYLSLGKK